MSKTLALALVLVFLTASNTITFLPAKAENKTIVVPDDYPTISEALINAVRWRYSVCQERNIPRTNPYNK